jgi:signal peptidase I
MHRYLFWPLWFLVVPACLAWLTVQLLAGGDPQASGPFERLRWFVEDQRVPALIIFFTLYEMLLYSYRHSLPFAGELGVAGRTDVPRPSRRSYENALHLLEDAARILRRHQASVERALAASVREELNLSLEALRREVDREHFDDERFREALEKAQALVSEHLAHWQKSETREYLESILIAITVALLLRAFVVEAFKIPSGSMLPTLQIQDHIFVNKLSYGPSVPYTKTRFFPSLPPKRGDVMVFVFPDTDPRAEPQDFIKRVIATEGDVLEVEGGHPIINGWRVPNCRVGLYEFYAGSPVLERGELYVEYLGDYAYLTLFEAGRIDGRQGPYHVAPGEVWVLGDNRNNSSDSRAWYGGRGGGVPYANIKGRAMFVWLAFDYMGAFTWSRLFTNVLGRPSLPPGASREILERLDYCLANRPSVTLPPPPSATDSSAEPAASQPLP